MNDLSSHGFRISPQQRQIWMSQQALPDRSFRAVATFIVAGNVDADRLRQALQRTVARHEIQRTTFHRPAGIKIPFQVVSENAGLFWQSLELKNTPEPEQQQTIAALFSAECNQPIKLDDAPVLRCHLVELSATRAALILSLPAMCADSQTLMNLATETFRSYESADEPAAEEVVQYADFAEWQNQILESDAEQAEQGRAYWKRKQAANAPTLPLERQLSQHGSPEYASVMIAAGDELVRQLTIVAAENKARLVEVLFTCWQALISRLAGERDCTVYKRCDARKLDELQAALGPFDRYLPISCETGPSLFVRQLSLVASELRQAEELMEYADVEDPGLASGAAIAFEFDERVRLDTEMFSIAPADIFVSSPPFKLKLSCVVSAERQLSFHVQYDRRVFYPETCERFGGYFKRLVDVVATTAPAARPTLTLGSIDLLSDDEKQTLLDLNDTSSFAAPDECVHELFEAQAAKTPTAVAVVCGRQQLTYEELSVQANQIAHLLREYGVEPGQCVGMCLTRSVAALVALLGILKAGAAYVPLDAKQPTERLAIELQKAQAGVCLTNVAGVAAALAPHVRIIEFARDAELIRKQPKTGLPVVISPDALAYVIYTSGSTGTPKGVAVRHRNLVNYARAILARFDIQEPLRFATVSTMSADLGNTCIFPSLFSGGCLHLLDEDVALEPRLFSDYVSTQQIDVLKIAPSHLHALLSDNEVLPAKYLVLGGEAFTRQLRDSILALPYSCRVINHYGPTETTVGALTFAASEPQLSDLVRTVPIGRPLPNMRAYVLDQQMRLVPTGVPGELYIGGGGVAAGYLNDPDLTAARFVPDLFSTEPGNRLYRTGDRARILPDGNIEFLGRTDRQVKVRGYRVEPGEIETVLTQHPLVRQAVVALRGEEGRERFVAYVMSRDLAAANTEELRQHLHQRLPEYMLPSAIVVLRSFPTTANGKVDVSALPDPDEEKARLVVAPQTAVEKELAAIWTELLKTADLSVHDNFFDLGGHSLLATQVISRIRKVFNKKLPLRAIFDYPTIAKLAPAIETAAYADPAALYTMLDTLEALSDEEAERLLQEQDGN
jgi:amino acid adenylation domain-containing protein